MTPTKRRPATAPVVAMALAVLAAATLAILLPFHLDPDGWGGPRGLEGQPSDGLVDPGDPAWRNLRSQVAADQDGAYGGVTPDALVPLAKIDDVIVFAGLTEDGTLLGGVGHRDGTSVAYDEEGAGAAGGGSTWGTPGLGSDGRSLFFEVRRLPHGDGTDPADFAYVLERFPDAESLDEYLESR